MNTQEILEKNIETLKKSLVTAKVETKANEVEHTTNTGFGAELVPGAILQSDILDLIPTYSSLLTSLRGNRGRNLPPTIDISVVGETGFYSTGSEWTTGALFSQVAQGSDLLATAKVTVTQKKYKMSVDISDEELRYSITDVEKVVMDRLAKSASRTVEAVIINGDTATGATGNVNSDDGAPTAGLYYLNQDGLRKEAIVTKGVANTDTYDLGTIAWSNYVDIQTQAGDLGANPDDYIWLFNRATYNKSMQLTEFKDASQNGINSSINGLGARTNILGSDVYIARDLTKTEADGKQSTTASNNTKGALIYLHKDAVQFGFNGDFNLEVIRVPGEGIQVIGYFYFGFGIANQLAGQTDPMVIAGINATV